MVRRAAKGVNERAARRYHAAGFARSCLRRARCATRGVHRERGGGIRSFTSKRTKKSCSRRQRGQTDVSSLRDHREARSSRSSCVRTGRELGWGEKFYALPSRWGLPIGITREQLTASFLVSVSSFVYRCLNRSVLSTKKKKKIECRLTRDICFWENIVSFYIESYQSIGDVHKSFLWRLHSSRFSFATSINEFTNLIND